jgi:hypothetical protein
VFVSYIPGLYWVSVEPLLRFFLILFNKFLFLFFSSSSLFLLSLLSLLLAFSFYDFISFYLFIEMQTLYFYILNPLISLGTLIIATSFEGLSEGVTTMLDFVNQAMQKYLVSLEETPELIGVPLGEGNVQGGGGQNAYEKGSGIFGFL